MKTPVSSPPPVPLPRSFPPSIPPPPTPSPPSHHHPRPLLWSPLHVSSLELSLPLTLPTGQSFRWRHVTPSHYTGVIGPHLLSLRHVPSHPTSHVSFLLHNPHPDRPSPYAALRDYFNLHVSLPDLWTRFGNADRRFAELAGRFEGGARVMRQDPVECLFQFLCSSNNNIGRIQKMVGVLEGFGEYLGTVGGVGFYRFPTVERLAEVSETELRDGGFGYRAKYIVGTAKALQSKPGGGENWLHSLRDMELPDVINNLCTLPGVGPKVAACIALFSLDQHHAIPVDTHVWKIATRYFLPELAGTRPNPRHFGKISDAFVAKFGEYAGWAQNVLFIGELPSQKLLLPQEFDIEEKKPKSLKRLKLDT